MSPKRVLLALPLVAVACLTACEDGLGATDVARMQPVFAPRDACTQIGPAIRVLSRIARSADASTQIVFFGRGIDGDAMALAGLQSWELSSRARR